LRGQLQDATEDNTQLKRITHVDYDAFGRAYQTTDANGNVQRRQFDRLGQTIVMTDIASGHQTSTSYDFLGRVLSQTDANQLTTTYKYDAAERSVTITSPGNIVVKKINNAAGQLLSVSDANGNQTSYQYDEDGQLKKTIRPSGTVVDQNLNIYNKRGLLSDSIDANGNLTHIEYDAAQRVLRRTSYSGAIPDNTKIISQTSAIYGGVSANGTFVDTIDANNLKTRSFYDNAGRLRQQVVDPDQGGLQLTTDYTYDNQGHTLTVIQRGSDRTKDRIHRYAYDGLGRRTDEFVGSYVIDTTVLQVAVFHLWSFW
jgi:YD repeat-containing protein